MRFKGKSAIVTGAASGIGLAVARRLAAEGARVVLGDRNLAGLEAAAAAIGDAASIFELNVADSASCDEIVAKAVAVNGALDVLCNVAGVLEIDCLANMTDDRWQRVISVNLNGVFYLSRAAMPHLLKCRGTIVNMASAAGLAGVPFNSAYTASKHAVVGLTKSLALEFAAQGVRINAVCPGGVKTPMIAGSGQAAPDGVNLDLLGRTTASWLDSGGLCEPEDIADAVAFLASNEARRITGIALPVDGGQTAN